MELSKDNSSRDQSFSNNEEAAIQQLPKKRVKTSGKPGAQSHKALMPATRCSEKSLNHSTNSVQCDDDQYDETAMDNLIRNHFKGSYY